MTYYLFIMVVMYIPIIKAMEPSDSSSNQPQRTSSSLKLKIDVDPKEKGILSLFPRSLKNAEMKIESYTTLKDISPVRAIDADIFKLHEELARLETNQKTTVLEILTELKGTAKCKTFKERLKEYPWISDYGLIYRYIQAAYEARGYPRANQVLDSCVSTLSSFHTSASPTPSYMTGTAPVSQFVYPTERTGTNIQQMQSQQLQMQQNQEMQNQIMQQVSTQLWTLAMKQRVEKDSEDLNLRDFIDPKKMIKNSIIVGIIALLSVGNSAVSYFLGGQSGC